jgi:hypothetical protein
MATSNAARFLLLFFGQEHFLSTLAQANQNYDTYNTNSAPPTPMKLEITPECKHFPSTVASIIY